MSLVLRAFIVGYTGESGKALVKALAKDDRYLHVVLIGRRIAEVDYGTDIESVKSKFEQKLFNFEAPHETPGVFNNNDVGFCCLGTTITKSGRDGQRKVDLDYVTLVAKSAAESGCKEFHIISSKGANHSSGFFYLRLKGEMEKALCEIRFPKALSFFRAASLICNRTESRFGERLFQKLLMPISHVAPTALTTPIETLALALANAPAFLSDVVQPSPVTCTSGEDPPSDVYFVNNAQIFILAAKSHQLPKPDAK